MIITPKQKRSYTRQEIAQLMNISTTTLQRRMEENKEILKQLGYKKRKLISKKIAQYIIEELL